MANNAVVRLGQTNGAGATDALFLKVFPGEIITAFERANVALPLTMVRTISSGKSAQFPVFGRASSAYHTPGNQLLGLNAMRHAEQVIGIDGLVVSHESVANIDEAMSHYDVRGEYSRKMGHELATKVDTNIFRGLVNGARASAFVTGEAGGTEITDADGLTNGTSLVSSIYTGAQNLDENYVEEDDRFVAVRPAQYWLLVQEDKLLDRDYGGANGVYADGKVMRAAGVHIIKSVNVPSTTTTADAGVSSLNSYHGNMTNVVAIMWHRSAFATVKLLDIATEKEYQVSRQSTLMVAKYAMGHGWLRPEALVEINHTANV